MANGMYHLDGLDLMINNSFKDIIHKADLTFKSYSQNNMDEYRLIGNKCQIRFVFDRGYISCTFINPMSQKVYHVAEVYKILYPDENAYSISLDVPYESQVDRYVQMIENKLMNIVEGDFSWENRIES